MAGVLQHLRSSTLDKRPNPASMVDGQVAINYASGSPGMFFKDSNGDLVKVGPVHVGSTAPNVSPASGGTAGNSKGEQWLDTSGGTYVFKVWDGSAWRSEAGEFVNVTGDTMTGTLTIGSGATIAFEGATDDGFETTLTVVDPTADRTITLPDIDGTVVTTGDSGTVTSAMIADGTIVNGDINASAAIAGTKISPDFGSQNTTTTGTSTAASFIPTSSTVPANGVYLPSANNVALSTNGTGRITVDASGNVNVDSGTVYVDAANNRLGVGTSSPQNALHAYHATDNAVLRVESGDEYVHIEFKDPTTTNIPYIGAQGNNLRMITGGAAAVTIDSSQRVGVGTTTPSSALTINNDGVGFRIERGSAVGYFYHNSTASTADLTIQSQVGAVQLFTENGANQPIKFVTNGSERCRVDSSGRLLVGTSSSTGIAGIFQAVGSSSVFHRTDNDQYPSIVYLSKARGTGAQIVANNDNIGNVSFVGYDGTNPIRAAEIGAYVDGTPGANDMPGRLVFSTTADGASSPTERMRIENTGQTRVFGTNNVILSRSSQAAGTTYHVFLGYHSATDIGSGGTASCKIYTNGNVENTNNSYGAISDIKLKENIVDASSQWDDIKALQVRNYNFKPETGAEQHTQLGLIAQEVELVSPGLVSESPDRDTEGNDLGTVTKSVNYSVLYMKAVKALQEAMERIETLEAKVAALESA